MHFDLLISRHAGLTQFLTEEGHTWDVHSVHVAEPEVLRGKNVLGVLPHHLSAQCETITEVLMDIPLELRGVELDAQQTRQCCKGLQTYTVRTVKL
jgi:putative CRISPR-associated protein (TIGR02620 family)